MRRPILAAFILVACGGNDAASAVVPEPVEANAKAPPAAPIDTSAPASPPASDALPCPKSPCTERPVIFVHGHTGGVSDGKTLLDRMIVAGERWDDWQAVGTADHQAWAVKSIPRRSWLFNFEYYLHHATDKRGTYTAGVGRIGSNGSFACPVPAGKGHIRPSSAVYDDGVVHDFGDDLARMVESVLRATGAAKVDLLVHSMGGLIARSFITFSGGADKVGVVTFLATPHLGVPFASAEALINQWNQSWMPAKELAELDRDGTFAQTKFMACGESRTDSWPNLLLAAEKKLPVLPTYQCMRGKNDVIVAEDSAHHPTCAQHVEVPDTDHAGIVQAREASDFARRTVGGYVTGSTKL